MKTAPAILRAAYDAWVNAAELRSKRTRQKRYTYGDQWFEPAYDHAGHMVIERDLLVSTGKRPLTNNLLRLLVKTVVGRFRTTAADSKRYDNAPDSFASRNCLSELDARLLEEFIISGCAIQRIANERRPQGTGVWIDNVSPADFFVNTFRDPRGFDIGLIGMIHDMTTPEIINRFGRGSEQRINEIERIYNRFSDFGILTGSETLGGTVNGNDFQCARPGKRRVFEIWRLEGRPDPKSSRKTLEMVWHCHWLAPDGSVLAEYDSPYAHKSHPFTIKLYPLIDGEVHSFIEDVIDQQRSINRMVVLIDTMMATAAKGSLLFPVDQIPKGITLEDIARNWAAPDGVIPIASARLDPPRQIVTDTANSGAYQLLNLQMQLFQDISGVNDALLGRNISPATGQAMYETQVRNAAVTLADLLMTFDTFLDSRDKKAAESQLNAF